jgi:hypothetical protein
MLLSTKEIRSGYVQGFNVAEKPKNLPNPHEVAAVLVDRAKRGDRAAFGELVRRYRQRIFALALHLTGTESDADDITQEVFLGAYRALDRFAGRFMPAVFNFAVRYLQRRPDLGPDFSLNDSDLEEFRALMPDWGVELSAGGFRKAERFIRFQLEREIALQAWGDAGEFRRTLPVDRAVQKAVELLTGASSVQELFGVAEAPDVSDWHPVVLEGTEEGAQGQDVGSAPETSPDGEGAPPQIWASRLGPLISSWTSSRQSGLIHAQTAAGSVMARPTPRDRLVRQNPPE